MIDGPELLRLESFITAADLTEAAALVRPLFAPLGLAGMAVDDAAPLPGWPDPLPQGARRLTPVLADHGTGSLHPAYGLAEAYQFNLEYDAIAAPDAAAVRRITALLADAAAGLAESGRLIHVGIYRHAGGRAGPVPPLAPWGTHLVSAADAEVAASYPDPAVFAAGWDSATRHGAVTLYRRAMDEAANPGFLAKVMPGQMALARAARAGQVRWPQPAFAPGEFALLDAGQPTLTGIGYDDAARLYEFAGFVPPGGDLRVIDLMLAAQIRADGWIEDADGTRLPVERVRAVFDRRAAAERAAPLLATTGTQSCYIDETGEMVEVASA
jgi:hypothetical protein